MTQSRVRVRPFKIKYKANQQLRKSIGTPKYTLTYDHLLLTKQLHPEFARLCDTIKILNATATLGLCRHCLNKSNMVVKLGTLT